MQIINKKYNISNKLNKRIVLISDIHYYNKNDITRLNKVLDNIKKINPDYICVAGDTLDIATPFDFNLLKEWLVKLTNISKVIMVLGNHEFYVNKKQNEFKLNDEYINIIKNIKNLYFLDTNNVIIDNINFIGITLPIEHFSSKGESIEDFKKYLKNIKTKNSCYNILLCHSPINISKKEILDKLNISLVLCGHMHGGVVPNWLRFIFKNNGIISPSKKLFPKNVYGNIKVKDKNVIITSGINVLSERQFPKLKKIVR